MTVDLHPSYLNGQHLSDYDFDLPLELIAQFPLAERTASRLLHVSDDVIEDLVFTDQVADRVCYKQDFQCGDSSASFSFAEGLCDNSLEGAREHRADLFLTVRRELLNDTVRGTGGGGRLAACADAARQACARVRQLQPRVSNAEQGQGCPVPRRAEVAERDGSFIAA